jgi:hypothetical protein
MDSLIRNSSNYANGKLPGQHKAPFVKRSYNTGGYLQANVKM